MPAGGVGTRPTSARGYRFGTASVSHRCCRVSIDVPRMLSARAVPAGLTPGRAVRKLILVERGWQHLDAVARRRRRLIAAVPHHRRVTEMLMQMIYPFDHPVLGGAAHSQV